MANILHKRMLAPEYCSSQEETDVKTEKTVHESQKKKRKMPTWEIIQTFDNTDDSENHRKGRILRVRFHSSRS
ncbi:hypothetical protein BpHYR1_036270 [Brachionus plicatilis]|uniref:Uncharacterized protein n=1 Tax=Brachionus plicatilis TaxID=10195 RepID=A0A3M7PJK9_BRAPC|nr:hypothetical protein BpHYR1_036270 [Brachionus plicatilis]